MVQQESHNPHRHLAWQRPSVGDLGEMHQGLGMAHSFMNGNPYHALANCVFRSSLEPTYSSLENYTLSDGRNETLLGQPGASYTSASHGIGRGGGPRIADAQVGDGEAGVEEGGRGGGGGGGPEEIVADSCENADVTPRADDDAMGAEEGFGAQLQVARQLALPTHVSSYQSQTHQSLPPLSFNHYTAHVSNQYPLSALSPHSYAQSYSTLAFTYPSPFSGHATSPLTAPSFLTPSATAPPYIMSTSPSDGSISGESRNGSPPDQIPRLTYGVMSPTSIRLQKGNDALVHTATSSDAAHKILPTALSTNQLTTPGYGVIGNPRASFYRAGSSSADGNSLPFDTFQTMHDLHSEGKAVMPVIKAATIRNVFWLEPHWTCYRRNYISVTCAYQLVNSTPGKPLYVTIEDGEASVQKQIQAMAMRLTAVVDKAQGKEILLVQYTPKRDRDGRKNVRYERAFPESRSLSNLASLADAPSLPLQLEDEGRSTSTSSAAKPLNVTFDRIQFETATQNNGRRRAEQQYYHLVVGLYGDIREAGSKEAKWIKVAHQVSDRIIVRGRSPRHYKKGDELANGPGGGPNGGSGGSAGGSSRSTRSPSQRRHGAVRGYGGSPSSGAYSRGAGYGQIGQQHHAPGPSQYTTAPPLTRYNVPSTPPVTSRPVEYRTGLSSLQTLREEFSDQYQDKPEYEYYPGHLVEHFQSMLEGSAVGFSSASHGAHRISDAGIPFKQEDGESSSSNAPLHPNNREAYLSEDFYTPRSIVNEGTCLHNSPIGQTMVPWQPDNCGRFQPNDTTRGWYPSLTSTGY